MYNSRISVHTKCLKTACDRQEIEHWNVGDTGVFVGVRIGSRNHYFIANHMPLNNFTITTIAEDKGHTYSLLYGLINMPRTISFVDPDPAEVYVRYVVERSIDEIVERCESEFDYPMIIKKNSGSQGEHVYRCEDMRGSEEAFRQIFAKNSPLYDHIALAQETVDVEREYRVTVLNRKIEIIYLKDNSRARFVGNLSPLHWKGAKAVLIDDKGLKSRIEKFIAPIFSVIDLEYSGLDIAIDSSGEMWLFEINSHPAYDHLVEDNGEEVLVNLYERILGYLRV